MKLFKFKVLGVIGFLYIMICCSVLFGSGLGSIRENSGFFSYKESSSMFFYRFEVVDNITKVLKLKFLKDDEVKKEIDKLFVGEDFLSSFEKGFDNQVSSKENKIEKKNKN